MSLTENSTVEQYKCPNCSAPIEYKAGTECLKCDYCECELDINTLAEYNVVNQQHENKVSWTDYEDEKGRDLWNEDEKKEVKKYACNSCGGSIMTDAVTVATKCPYCESAVISPTEMSGEYRPDMVLPFQVSKEDAISGLSKYLEGKKLLPDSFASRNYIEDVTGVYVPFWLFDSKVNGQISYKATKMRTWRVGDYQYTRTDFYMVKRGGNVNFLNVPADGSSKMDDTLMESIEPFDYSKGVDFNTAYLSGYLAQNYDVKSGELEDRISQRMGNSMLSLCDETVHGYTSKTVSHKSITNEQGDIRYALLPVWILNTKYNGQLYTFAMNGQSGKFVGELPIDKAKAVKYFLKSFVVSLISCSVVYAIVNQFM